MKGWWIAWPLALAAFGAQTPQTVHVPVQRFVEAASTDDRAARAALDAVRAGWQPGYTSLILEFVRFIRGPRAGAAADISDAANATVDTDDRRAGTSAPALIDRGSPERRRLLQFLSRQTGQRFGDDLDQWRWYAQFPDTMLLP